MSKVRLSVLLLLAGALAVSPAFGQADRQSDKQSTSRPQVTTAPPAVNGQAVEFGDDSSEWANDEECDDPRFEGDGMAEVLLDEDLMKDATDCRALYEAGRIRLRDGDSPTPSTTTTQPSTQTAGLDFGDDSSNWANDGECDDPRFGGRGSARILLDADLMKDATDCRTLYESGRIVLKEDLEDIRSADGTWSFGDNTSEWANNDECDDPRFVGAAMAEVLINGDMSHDANDCKAAYDSKQLRLIPVFHPGYVRGAPYSTAGVDFGNDTSDYANDDECDDPRFIGPGMGSFMDDNINKDATDCRELFTAGQVALKD